MNESQGPRKIGAVVLIAMTLLGLAALTCAVLLRARQYIPSPTTSTTLKGTPQ